MKKLPFIKIFASLGIATLILVGVSSLGNVREVHGPSFATGSKKAPTAKAPAVAPYPAEFSKAAPNVGAQEPALSDWKIAYGHEFWRERTTSHGETPFDVNDVVDRVGHSFSTAGVVQGSAYRAELLTSGFRFYPRHLEHAVQKPYLETGSAQILMDGKRLPHLRSAWVIEGNVAQRTLNADGSVVEHVEARRDGISMTWVLRQPFATDLAISWPVTGMAYENHSEDGAHFTARPGEPGVRIGNVTAVDAGGVRTPLPLFRSNEGVRIEIPATLLAQASYPLAIDPTVSAEFDIDPSSSGVQLNCRVARLGNEWLVAWTDDVNSPTPGVMTAIQATRVTSTGEILNVWPMNITSSNTTSHEISRICLDSNDSKWMVGWCDTNHDTIYARAISSEGGVGATITVNSQAANYILDVAGLGSQWLFALDTSVQVVAQRVSDTATIGAPIPLAFGTFHHGLDVESNGANWLVLWAGYEGGSVGSSFKKAKIQPVDAQGTTGSVTTLLTESNELQYYAASLATSGGIYLALWEHYNVGVEGIFLNSAGVPSGGTFAISEPSGLRQTNPIASATDNGWHIVWTTSNQGAMLARSLLTNGTFGSIIFPVETGASHGVGEAINGRSLVVYRDADWQTKGVLLKAAKEEQNIRFSNLRDRQFDAAPIQLNARSSAKLNVSYNVSGPAQIKGDSIVLKGLGTVKVTARQKGNGIYARASSVSRTFKVTDTEEPKITSLKAPRVSIKEVTIVKGVIRDNYRTEKIKYRIKTPKEGFSKFHVVESKSGLGKSQFFALEVPTPVTGSYTVEVIPIDGNKNAGRAKEVEFSRIDDDEVTPES